MLVASSAVRKNVELYLGQGHEFRRCNGGAVDAEKRRLICDLLVDRRGHSGRNSLWGRVGSMKGMMVGKKRQNVSVCGGVIAE